METRTFNHPIFCCAREIAPWHLLKKDGQKPSADLEKAERTKTSDRGPGEGNLVCLRCEHPITSQKARIEINGSHDHTFANPSGHIYRIGCFGAAPGAMSMPEEIAEFSWFAGYAWSVSGCSLCGEHLGWRFRDSENFFYGLILSRLVEKGQQEH